MNFIELTPDYGDDLLTINPSHIISMIADRKHKVTIELSSGRSFKVQESIEEIKALSTEIKKKK